MLPPILVKLAVKKKFPWSETNRYRFSIFLKLLVTRETRLPDRTTAESAPLQNNFQKSHQFYGFQTIKKPCATAAKITSQTLHQVVCVSSYVNQVTSASFRSAERLRHVCQNGVRFMGSTVTLIKRAQSQSCTITPA